MSAQHTPGLAVVCDEGNYEVSLHGRSIGYYFLHNTLEVRGPRNENLGCAGTADYAIRLLLDATTAKAAAAHVEEAQDDDEEFDTYHARDVLGDESARDAEKGGVMSAQHPPRPWRVNGDTCGWRASHDGIGCSSYIAVKDASGEVIALVVSHDAEAEPFTGAPDTQSVERLIAAAPDLLAAALEFMHGEGNCIATRHMFRAAIAKATGAAA